jgi:hypothetical protein
MAQTQSAYECVVETLAQLGDKNEPSARSLALQYEILGGLKLVNARRLGQLETVVVRDRPTQVMNDRERRVRAYVVAPFIDTEIG